MEHPSCKNHVADVTIVGTDVVVHYWDEGKQNSSTYISFCHVLLLLFQVSPQVDPHGAYTLQVQELL